MLTLCVCALIFSILPYRLAAQFTEFPVCVQPLLNRNFPPSCLSLSLTVQNTCLCQNAAAFGSNLVKAVNQECGCADLQETAQLTEAYCNQVGIDIGPAFDVFIQDNTPCGGGSGGGPSVSATSTGGSGGGSGGGPSVSATSSGGSGGGAITPGSGGSTVTVSVGGGDTSTTAGGATSTGSAGGSNTAGSSASSSGANERLSIEQTVGIIVIGITGGMLALRY